MIDSILHTCLSFFLLFLVPKAQVFHDSHARIAGTNGTCREGYVAGAFSVGPKDDCAGQCMYQESLSGFDSPFSPYTCQKGQGEQVVCHCDQCPCPDGTYGPECKVCSSDSSCDVGQTCDRSGVFSSTSNAVFDCKYDEADDMWGPMLDSCIRGYSDPGAIVRWDAAARTMSIECYCNMCTLEDPVFLTISCHSAVHQVDTLDPVTQQITSDSPCKSQGLPSPCVRSSGPNCVVTRAKNLSEKQYAMFQIVEATVQHEPFTSLACSLHSGNTSLCSLVVGPVLLSLVCRGGGTCRSGGSEALLVEGEIDSSQLVVIFCVVALTVLPLFLLCYLQLMRSQEHALIVKVEPVAPELPSMNAKWNLHWSGVTCLRAGLPVVDNMCGQLETSPGSGCLVSLMGASGSGKTTLIATLAGRGLPSDKGTVSICGAEMDAKSRRAHIGYVPQMEVLGASLTVREAIAFSAALRLPHLSGQQRAEHISWVLERLDLQSVANSRIGDDKERGISGGQRRRVAIGTELIANPMILFLDEPTTGLDAAAALALGKLLRELANEGRLLLCTLHQPRPELLKLFNVQLELKSGVLTNDFLGKEDYPSTSPPCDVNPGMLKHAHQSSTRCWLMQIVILWRRFLTESARGNAKGYTSALTVLGMALLVSLVYSNMDTGFEGVLNRYGAIFFLHMFFAFCGLQACVSWHADRPRFEFECSNSYYSSWAYLLASSTAYLWWYCFMLPLVYTAVLYPLIGFSTAGYKQPLFSFLCISGISVASSGISLLLLAISGTLMTGIALSASLLTVFLLFAGFLMPVDRLPELVVWIHSLSPFSHSYAAMLVNELHGLQVVFDAEGYDEVRTTGDLWLEQYAIRPDPDSVSQQCLILWIIALAAWLLCLPAWRGWPSTAASRLCRFQGVRPALSSQPKIMKTAPDTSQQYEKLKQEFFSELMWREMSLHLRSGQKVFADLSGCATARCPLAVLGPSGCGKTSLLGLLAGRGPAGGPFAAAFASGTISVDNVNVDQQTLRRFVGYVWQDEAMHAELTVKEVLFFAAALGLSTCTAEERRYRVHSVLRQLDLEDVVNSRIGDERKRGISGGERRRTAVGLALVAARPVLVLDEPTSGLDSEVALKLCQILAKLGEEGHVVISSLHQPSPEVLSQFQKVLVLSSDGFVAYWGTPEQLDARIESFSATASPSDFTWASDRILDIVSAGGSSSNVLCSTQSKYVRDWLTKQEAKPAASETTKINIHQAFSKRPSFMEQCKHLFMREFRISLRDRNRVFSHYGLAILMSLLFGYTFQKLPHNLSPGIFGRFGFFFSLQCLFAFQALQCLMAWSESYVGSRREHASGYYSISAFTLAKSVTDNALLRIGPPLLFGGIVYHLTGMQSGKEDMFLVAVSFTALTSAACCFFLGTLAPCSGAMLAVAVLLQLIFLLFNGFLLHDGPGWLLSLSHLRPSYVLMLSNELMNIPFQLNVKGVSDEVQKLLTAPLYGEAMLELINLEPADGDNVCKMVIFYFSFMLLSWIVLEVRAFFSRPQCSPDAASPAEELLPAGNQDASDAKAESSAASAGPEAKVLGASSVMPNGP